MRQIKQRQPRVKNKKITDSYAVNLIPEDVSNYLSCDEKTGCLIWKKHKKHSSIKVGTKVSTLDKDGYLTVMFNKKHYRAHRVCFYLYHNRQPLGLIDHINGIVTDNRKSNLREVNYSENGMNRKVGKNNKSGTKGVVWHKTHKKWMAHIQISGKNIFLGYFINKENAVRSRIDAEKKTLWRIFL